MLNKLQALRNKMKKKGKGFTLVELIVVIIIIAVIAAVAIPAITGFQDNARKSRIESEHRQLVSAMQSFAGSQAEPENVTNITLNDLAPYISKTKTGSTIDDQLAQNPNGKGIAHKISGTTLTSQFFKSGTTGTTADREWTYDLSKAGVSSAKN